MRDHPRDSSFVRLWSFVCFRFDLFSSSGMISRRREISRLSTRRAAVLFACGDGVGANASDLVIVMLMLMFLLCY